MFLDNVLLSDFSILFNYQLNNVDYIVIDKSGFGQGIRGSAGVIKIFTDPSISLYSTYGKVYQEYDVPLSFSSKKRFYTPTYAFYKSSFFKEYGVIGWIPNTTIDANGKITFYIYDTTIERVSLFIEGVTNDGQFISEEKNITIE